MGCSSQGRTWEDTNAWTNVFVVKNFLICLILHFWLPVQKFLRKHHCHSNVYYDVAKCSPMNFCCKIFTHKLLSICMQISGSSELITLTWVSLETSFLLQDLSIDNANFGQRWWHKNFNKGQRSSWPVTTSTGYVNVIICNKCEVSSISWKITSFTCNYSMGKFSWIWISLNKKSACL